MKKILHRALVSCPDGKATLLRQRLLFSRWPSAVTELELTPQQSQQTEPSVGRHLARLPGSQLERQPGVSAYPIHESTEGNEAAVGGVSTAGPKALLDVFAD